MTEFRVSVRSDLDAGEAGNGRSDAPMDVAMEMATAATTIAAETAGAIIFDPMERNENGKRRRMSEAPAASSDWRSRMVRTIRQQAQELMQLPRTVGHLANLVEARAAHEEAQQLAIMTCISKKHLHLGGMAPSEWTRSVRAVRDTPVADYSAPGVITTRRVAYRPLIAVSSRSVGLLF
jgi:hypothetical protein